MNGAVHIVGGGPAGMILASELARGGREVVVLESGPADGSAQDLSQAEVTGDPINALNLEATRERRLGGNANTWVVKTGRKNSEWTYGVRYGPQTDLTMSERSWIDASGWPVDRDELLTWTRRAHQLLADGEFDYDDTDTDSHISADRADKARGEPSAAWLAGDSFDRRLFAFGPKNRVLIDLRLELERSPAVQIIEGATVTQLHQANPGGPVDRLAYMDRNGHRVELEVETVVLAGGGVENARLLLNSERQRGGIGNETDNVGRYFMDHPLWAVGDIKLADTATLADLTFFDFRTVNGATRHGHLVTDRAWCQANEATEMAVALLPRPRRRVAAAIDHAKYVAASPRHYANHPRELLNAATTIAGGLDHLPWAVYLAKVRGQSVLPGFGRGGWSDASPTRWFRELEVVFQCEQQPLRDSRITLSDQRDRFGIPLPKVTWRLGEQTRRSALELQRLIAERTEAGSIGHYEPRAGDLDHLGPPTSIAHHIGATRMSLNPADGVVDPDSRVHTCRNLYIAGSSVFPVGGYVNPTLTIAALAMRLAKTISDESGGDEQAPANRPLRVV